MIELSFQSIVGPFAAARPNLISTSRVTPSSCTCWSERRAARSSSRCGHGPGQ